MAVALLDEFGSGDALERAESWRYSRTALRALGQNDFVAADARADVPADLQARFDWPETRGRRLVFVNGVVSPQHSQTGELTGARLALDAGGFSFEPARDGESLHVVYVSLPGPVASRWSSTASIRIATRNVRLVEQHLGVAGADVLGSLRADVEISACGDASLIVLCDLPDSVSLYRREQVDIGERGAHAGAHALFGGRLQRHEAVVTLAGAQSRHVARGAFVLRGRQHTDVHLDVRHSARDTACDVLWRGVADQRARGILHGAITVAAGADGADARLQTKNLLLSPHAEIDAQPVLEIHADEVKASHGATVGQLDANALFYLRSRGIPAAAARSLLIGGFCREAFADIADAALQTRLAALLDERLPQPPGGTGIDAGGRP
jgi:Fe-S cluster assembly protein SufD